jgi:hypothetical protein
VKLRYVKKIASLITEDPDIVESINESAYEGLEDADEFEEEELPDGPWFMSISQKNPNLNLDTESLVEMGKQLLDSQGGGIEEEIDIVDQGDGWVAVNAYLPIGYTQPIHHNRYIEIENDYIRIEAEMP